MHWHHQRFEQLDINTLYDIIKLRVDVFVVEQSCHYPELDEIDRDKQTLHVYAYDDKKLVGYLRCLAPGVVYANQSAIGRVVITADSRGSGLGHELISQGIGVCEKAWPRHDIKMGAQAHLQKYYHQHEFETASGIYLDDGIPHVSMIRKVVE